MLCYFVKAATEQENLELKKGYLCDKLRHTVDPGEISTLVEQLHELDKGRRQSEVPAFKCCDALHIQSVTRILLSIFISLKGICMFTVQESS